MFHFIMNPLILVCLNLALPGATVERYRYRVQEPVCRECHSEIAGRERLHAAVEDACDHCHASNGEPHPGDGGIGFTLVEEVPGLCYICHEVIPALASGHQPVAEKKCLECHDAHGSPEPGMLKFPERQLCISCHREIGAITAGNNRVHAAITEGGCILCHLPHGSEFQALLVERYPVEEYVEAVAGNFELCFMCHSTELIDTPQTASGTGFRNGTRNLHHLHVNGAKGRNCRLCHNLHASREKFLISESVPFGNWEMRLNFISVENGGSCLPGCHGKESYARDTRQ